MNVQPFQDIVDPFSVRSANAVKDNDVFDVFSGFPSHVQHSSSFDDSRPTEGVIAAPQNATFAGRLLTPDHPIPCVFPHALVKAGVSCSVPVGVEFFRSDVSIKAWRCGEPQESLPQGRVLVAPLFSQLPNATLPHGFLAPGQFCEGDLKVVVSQHPFFLFAGHVSNFFWAEVGNTRHQQRPIHQLIDAFCAPGGQQTSVSGKECIGCGIEQISAQGDGHREQHRMAATEHVNGPARGKKGECGHHDFGVFLVALLFHDRDDAADGMNGEGMLGHEFCRDVPKLSKNATLHGAVQHRIACGLKAQCCSGRCLANRLFHFAGGHVGAREDVQHRCNVDAYGRLKGDDILHAHLHVAVDVGLEGARIRHDNARKIQKGMDALFLNRAA